MGKRRTPSAGRGNWPMLVGLLGFAFLLYVWVWAATQGGPPFWG